MKIAKVINNNVISVVNEQGKELVVMGRGLAFQKKSGDDVDEAAFSRSITRMYQKSSKPFCMIYRSSVWKYPKRLSATQNYSSAKSSTTASMCR